MEQKPGSQRPHHIYSLRPSANVDIYAVQVGTDLTSRALTKIEVISSQHVDPAKFTEWLDEQHSDRRVRIFVAGPTLQSVSEQASDLQNAGWQVVHCAFSASDPIEQYESNRASLRAMSTCGFIGLAPDWEEDKNCVMLKDAARMMNLGLMLLPRWEVKEGPSADGSGA